MGHTAVESSVAAVEEGGFVVVRIAARVPMLCGLARWWSQASCSGVDVAAVLSPAPSPGVEMSSDDSMACSRWDSASDCFVMGGYSLTWKIAHEALTFVRSAPSVYDNNSG